MGARGRRGASVAAAAIGLLCLALAVEVVVRQAGAILAQDEHLRGDALLALAFFALPSIGAAAIALAVALDLRDGRRWARLAGAILAAGAIAGGLLVRPGGYLDALWAAGTLVGAPARLRVAWPRLHDDHFAPGSPLHVPGAGPTPLDQLPSAAIVALDFWWSLLLVGAGLLLAGILAWTAVSSPGLRGRRPGPMTGSPAGGGGA